MTHELSGIRSQNAKTAIRDISGKFSSGVDPMVVWLRFWSRVDKTGSCWNWTGYLMQETGYGGFTVAQKHINAHRFAYEKCIGPVPKGLELDHLCRNRACVNPAHLEPVTHRENMLRGTGVVPNNLKKTHCPQGHPYSGDNLKVRKHGWRECKQCNREAARKSRNRMVV